MLYYEIENLSIEYCMDNVLNIIVIVSVASIILKL